MTDMTLEQVLGNIRDAQKLCAEDAQEMSFEGYAASRQSTMYGLWADAIDAHLAKAAQGEAVAWQYRRDGVEWHPLKEEFIEKAIRDGVEVRALYAAPPIAKPAQPVEALDVRVALELAEQALMHARPKMDHYPEPDVRHREALAAIRAALAHPRPTLIPEERDSELHARAPDEHHEIARAVWESMNRRSAPGVIMTMAYTAVLRVLASRAPTGEQEGEVAWIDHTPSGVVLRTLGECKRLEDLPHGTKLYAQPRPVGVPEGWTVERGPDVLGQASMRVVSPEGEERLYGIFEAERLARDFLMAAFPVAAAPDGEVG